MNSLILILVHFLQCTFSGKLIIKGIMITTTYFFWIGWLLYILNSGVIILNADLQEKSNLSSIVISSILWLERLRYLYNWGQHNGRWMSSASGK